MQFDFVPRGVCARYITFELDEQNTLHKINFIGGCPGNLQAISKLLEGADALKTANTLKGNLCGQRGTSCADQLAIAIEEALAHYEHRQN